MIIGIDARELAGQATGTGRYLRNLLKRWQHVINHRFVAYFNGPVPPDESLSSARVTTKSLCARPRRGLIWQQILLPRAAVADGIDVLFAPAYFCPLALRAPVVTTVHDLSCFYYPADFTLIDGVRRRLLLAASVRVSKALLVVSRFTRDETVRRFPSSEKRVFHVPLGADDDLIPALPRDDARRRLGLDGPLVLSVGSIFNRRCAPELLQAFARLLPSFPSAVLDIVGDNRTSPRLDLSGLAASLGISHRVRLSAFVDELGLTTRLSAADVFVSLSEYEGFGLTALEAMARGIPVVASSRPSLSEICGDAALLVDPRQVPQITTALSLLLADPALRLDYSERGRSRAALYSWSVTAERTLEVLEAACQ